jgi:hypothetical protein
MYPSQSNIRRASIPHVIYNTPVIPQYHSVTPIPQPRGHLVNTLPTTMENFAYEHSTPSEDISHSVLLFSHSERFQGLLQVNGWHLGTRWCMSQKRYNKLVGQTPTQAPEGVALWYTLEQSLEWCLVNLWHKTRYEYTFLTELRLDLDYTRKNAQVVFTWHYQTCSNRSGTVKI